MEEKRQISEKSVGVSSKWQIRAEVMMVKRERQVEAERQAFGEKAAQMEAERRAAAMKRPLEFNLRLCTINFPLEFRSRLCNIDISHKLSFGLTFQMPK